MQRLSSRRPGDSWVDKRRVRAGEWTHRLRRWRELLPEIVLVLASAYLWYCADGFRQVEPGQLGPDFWPKLLSALLGLTACVRLALKMREMARSPAPAPAHPADAVEDDEPVDYKKAAVVIALSIAYVLGVIYLGYPVATALFLACFIWLAGRRSWLINIPLSVAGALIFAYIFQKLVFIDLPTGEGIFDTFTVWLYHLIGIY